MSRNKSLLIYTVSSLSTKGCRTHNTYSFRQTVQLIMALWLCMVMSFITRLTVLNFVVGFCYLCRLVCEIAFMVWMDLFIAEFERLFEAQVNFYEWLQRQEEGQDLDNWDG
jgi:hypothetical protein